MLTAPGIFLNIVLPGMVWSAQWSDSVELYENLITNHNPTIRPKQKMWRPTVVFMNYTLLSLLEVDEVEGTVGITGYFTISWTDEMIQWQGSKYGGLTKMTLLQSSLWRPPLIVINSAINFEIIGMKDCPIKISQIGNVVWQPGQSIIFGCPIDATYFPFDTQKCYFEVRVWGYDSWEVSLNSTRKDIDLVEYKGHGEWELLHTKVMTKINKNDGSYSVKFHFQLKRRSTFFVVGLLVPLLIMAFLSVLVFILPHESGERVGLSITIFLSITVFLTIAQDILPGTSTPRLSAIFVTLGLYILLSCCITFSVIIGAWIFHRSPDKKIPSWLIYVYSPLFKLQCT